MRLHACVCACVYMRACACVCVRLHACVSLCVCSLLGRSPLPMQKPSCCRQSQALCHRSVFPLHLPLTLTFMFICSVREEASGGSAASLLPPSSSLLPPSAHNFSCFALFSPRWRRIAPHLSTPDCSPPVENSRSREVRSGPCVRVLKPVRSADRDLR